MRDCFPSELGVSAAGPDRLTARLHIAPPLAGPTAYKQRKPTDPVAPFELILADGTIYPHEGKFAFAGRQVNQSTGASEVTGVFAKLDLRQIGLNELLSVVQLYKALGGGWRS